MVTTLRAVYRKGAFIPHDPCPLPENSEVELIVQGNFVMPPPVTDPAERTRILQRLTQRMKNNPIPPEAPRFTREELHERD